MAKLVIRGGNDDNDLTADYADTLIGGKGNDELSSVGGKGWNVLYGNSGDDDLTGFMYDELYGGKGDDHLSALGGFGHNLLNGGTGNDVLMAGYGDTLYGGEGDDEIFFHRGGNTASGGKGHDEFQIASWRLPNDVNIITDFKPGSDKLEIKHIQGLKSFKNLEITQDGKDALISFGDIEIALLKNINADQLKASDFDIDKVEKYYTNIKPDDFVKVIDNPYLPKIAGSHYTYEAATPEGLERVEVNVLNETRMILGVEATVVRDIVYLDGKIVEDTYDWFAQDKKGNVWYFGEDVTDYIYDDQGKFIGTEKAGSWEAGVDGAQAGILMYSRPDRHIGDTYLQEYYAGEAEDTASVLSDDAVVELAKKTYHDVIQTYDFTPLDQSAEEYKYYAENVGLIKIINLDTGKQLELIDYSIGA